ncbi:MAG: hypothetical protein QF570_12915 [Myxococcota bacterium]|jgi:hypothetical protein|nr:hypothetical protein [Myxococcota bacterium]
MFRTSVHFVFVASFAVLATAPAAEPTAPVYTNADLVASPGDTVAEAPGPLLEWSEKPGVYEGELRRRHNNPLYVDSRREIAESDLSEAKRRDAAQMWAALESYVGLANDKKRMARYELASEMGEALLRLDENTWNALRVGGEAYALAAATQKVRTSLIDSWQDVASVDPGVKALLDAEARIPSVETESPAIRFLALLQAESGEAGEEDGPIRRYELGAALLSEDAETIRKVHALLRGDLRDSVREQLASVLSDIGRAELEFEGKWEKVTVAAELLEKRPVDFGVTLDTTAHASELR